MEDSELSLQERGITLPPEVHVPEVVEALPAPPESTNHEELRRLVLECHGLGDRMLKQRGLEDEQGTFRPARRNPQEPHSRSKHYLKAHHDHLVLPEVEPASTDEGRWENLRTILHCSADEGWRTESPEIVGLTKELSEAFRRIDIAAALRAEPAYWRLKLGNDVREGDQYRASCRLLHSVAEAGTALRSPELRSLLADSIREVASALPIEKSQRPAGGSADLRSEALAQADRISPRALPAPPARTAHGLRRFRHPGKALHRNRG